MQSQMASHQSLSSSSWTAKHNKEFEEALVIFNKDTPDSWNNVATMVGRGKSAEDVKRHYQDLLDDLKSIESGQVPFPNYKPISTKPNDKPSHITDDDSRQMMHLKLQ